MYLVRLIYASKVSENFDPGDVEGILKSARDGNAPKAVTGLLLFTTDYFVQCLEGSRSCVNEIYAGIMRDPRHNRVELLYYQCITKRIFPTWDMAYIGPRDVSHRMLVQHSAGARFDPYSMSPETALSAIACLAEQLGTESTG